MLTALPPSSKTAIEDDRPIVMGRVDRPDFYVLAHEARNLGRNLQSVYLLRAAAADLDIYYGFGESYLDEWDLNIEAIDKAWGEKQKQLLEQSQPAPNPVQMMRVARSDLFLDALLAKENDRHSCAAILLQFVARIVGFEGDFSGTFLDDWDRNFEGVHQAWVKAWESEQ